MPQETEEYFGSLGETPTGIKELQDWIDGTGKHKDRTQGQKIAARTIMEEHEKQIQKMLEEEDIKVTKKEAREELIKELKKEKKKDVVLNFLESYVNNISIKSFVKMTGMNKNTARRELGQAVKRGDITRVKRGVYRFK
jgi:Fic family protein